MVTWNSSLAITLLLPFLGGICLAQSAGEEGVAGCERLVSDYAYYRDHMDADNFENLFTEDATLGSSEASIEYSEYLITCKLVGESWKIADLSMHPLFRAEQ